MGIISLNSFLNASNYKKNMYIHELKNKKICVDIYNFIYKFLANGKLIPQLEKMCKLFHKHNIHVLFVFDGKYDKIKEQTQINRKKKRETAEKKYQTLMLKKNLNKNDKRILGKVKRERVKVTKWDIYDTKKCLDHCGMKYVVANGEAEEFCAELVNKNKVFACMSDDTDMFPYGCKNVIRRFNINNKKMELYNYKNLLNDLMMSSDIFKIICCLSSNDYNSKSKKKNFIYYNNLYQKYFNEKHTNFLVWLKNNNYLSLDDIENFNYIKDIYDLKNKNVFKNTKYIVIRNGEFNQKAVNILSVERDNYLAELYNK